MVDIIPDLVSCVILLAFSIGFLFGEAGANFDQDVKYGVGKEWYESLNIVSRYVLNVFLNVTHHFQYGLVSIIVGYLYFTDLRQIFFWYVGWGLIVADVKDFKNILKRLGFITVDVPEEPRDNVDNTLTNILIPTKTYPA